MGFCGLDSSYTVQQVVDCSKTCQVRAWKSGHKQEGRQKRVFDKMREASNARTHAEVVKIAEEGQTVAGELRRAKPDVAAEIHGMLWANSLGILYGQQGELEKAITEHEQARAIAVEVGHRKHEGHACETLGLSEFLYCIAASTYSLVIYMRSHARIYSAYV